MATVHSQITSAATTISENIIELAGNRKLMSKNILEQLRDLTEGVNVRDQDDDTPAGGSHLTNSVL
ncbi:hypothetical protein [Glaciibacter flavus]|uniref:hypothetical protein n=1 Tax=Orlajensenia flava TaxID=2565934 RepID=UPI003B002676